MSHVYSALSTLGLDGSAYAGHSFRIGAATTAAQSGIADSTIQVLGQWKSAAFLRFIKTPHQDLAPYSLTLVRHMGH